MYNKEEKITNTSEYFLNTPSETAKQLFFYPTAIGQFDYMAGYDLMRSRYDSYLLIFIEKGEMEITIDKGTLTAHSGDVALINCYLPHGYSAKTDCKTICIHFDGSTAKQYFDYITEQAGNVITPANYRSLYQQMYSLFNDHRQKEKPNEISVSLAITSILQGLISSLGSNDTVSDGVKKTTAYIAKNYKNKISLSDLSELAGFSPYYFTRVFKKETGMTPHQYLLSTRISVAKYNLSTTRMTISEIASNCGFDDDSAFCYAFKKWEGMTPTQYRANK